MSARISRRQVGRFAALLFACSVLTALAPSVRAEEPVKAEVIVVLGVTEGASVDPALNGLDALAKPPFDSFPTKKLLAKNEVVLELGNEGEVTLPNGRKLRLTLVERTPEGRYRVKVSINKPSAQDYLPLLTVVATPGDPFFIAGQKHAGGTMIIGVRVGAAKAPAPAAK